MLILLTSKLGAKGKPCVWNEGFRFFNLEGSIKYEKSEDY